MRSDNSQVFHAAVTRHCQLGDCLSTVTLSSVQLAVLRPKRRGSIREALQGSGWVRSTMEGKFLARAVPVAGDSLARFGIFKERGSVAPFKNTLKVLREINITSMVISVNTFLVFLCLVL